MKNEVVKCPVCKGTKNCKVHSTGIDGISVLHTRFSGTVDLTLCLNCGCVFVADKDLEWHRRFSNER